MPKDERDGFYMAKRSNRKQRIVCYAEFYPETDRVRRTGRNQYNRVMVNHYTIEEFLDSYVRLEDQNVADLRAKLPA